MTELMNVTVNENDEQVLSARELHKHLEINSKYTTWINRMIDYGFTENVDYISHFPNLGSTLNGGQNKIDHIIKLDMAKEIAMLQRSEKGKEMRKYLIQLEKDWNSPDKVMARALVLAHKTIATQRVELEEKTKTLNILTHVKKLYTTTEIAKELGMRSAIALNKALCDNKIQFKQNGTYMLYSNYADLGYESIKQDVLDNGRVIYHRKWTQRGREFILNALKGE